MKVVRWYKKKATSPRRGNRPATFHSRWAAKNKGPVKSDTWNWRKERCPHCNMKYTALKTGLTWDYVKACVRAEHEAGKRHHYTRRTVLGWWHGYKQTLWKQHIDECRQAKMEHGEGDADICKEGKLHERAAG